MTGGLTLLLYALGGGLGHLTRAVALGRRALARGHRVGALINTRYAPLVPYRRELPGADIVELSSALDGPAAGLCFDELYARLRPDAVLIDTFARGLGGELAERLPGLAANKILTHRAVAEKYVQKASLRTFAGHYERILVPGEPAALADLPHAVTTAPWLIRDSDELLDYTRARSALAAPVGAPVVMVVGSGTDPEIEEARTIARTLRERLGERACVRFVAPGEPNAPWPLLPLLSAVDVVVGSGGYNLVHECRATGTPLVAIARPRLYDRQHLRLRGHERVADADAALARTCALLDRPSDQRPASQRPSPRYHNGTHAALTHIEALGRLR